MRSMVEGHGPDLSEVAFGGTSPSTTFGGPPPRAGEEQVALRLGLRQIDGFPEHAAAQLVNAREEGGRFHGVAELRERAGLISAHVEKLAAADCFGSLELPRRQALWDARSLLPRATATAVRLCRGA